MRIQLKILITTVATSLLLFSCSRDYQSLSSDDDIINSENVNQLTNQEDDYNTQYIVVIKKGKSAENVARANGINNFRTFTVALNGFVANIPNESALNGLRNNPNVEYIEKDIKVQAFAQSIPFGIDRIDAEPGNGNQIDATGVDVAIIDSGIDSDHPDLNVVNGIHFWTETKGPPRDRGPRVDNNYEDDNGHGTHVGGTVAALDNSTGVVGVAAGAKLWGIKVLDANGSGYLSDIINGVDFVTANASEIEIANMSLGGIGNSTALRTAIANSVAAGVVYIVAAGNESRDVYGYDGQFNTSDDVFPASYPEVAAISAYVDTDGRPGGNGPTSSYGADDGWASYSNYSSSVVTGNPVVSNGKAIDLILPGVDIYSTYLNGGYAYSSGTSMAAPHAAGLAANYIAQNGRATNASEVAAIRQALITNGIEQSDANGLSYSNDPDGNYEKLGWAGLTGPQPPVADAGSDITISDTDGNGQESVTLDGSASYDPDGGSLTYNWYDGTQLVGTTAVISYSLTVSGSPHTLTLEVTDDENETTTDNVSVIVNANRAPVANAGSNMTVSDNDGNGSETVTLDGSGSSDDGQIIEYEWYNGTTLLGTGEQLSQSFDLGSTTVTLHVTDNAGVTSTDEVVVTVNEPSIALSLNSITPNSGNEGTSVNVTISGTGIANGASLTLENGSGPAPDITNINVVDSSTLTATIVIKSGGPPKNRTWDVRVTNPDGSTDVLSGSFTVIAQ